jgi:VWFA-related protein
MLSIMSGTTFLRVSSVFLLIVLGLSVVSSGQQNPSTQGSQEPAPIFRLQTNLILTRFHVVKDNFYVDTIQQEDVRVLQDKRLQDLAVFEGPHTRDHTIPVEIVFVFDVSFSVIKPGLLNGRLLKEKVIDRLGNHVSISVYGFANRVKRFCEPTRDFKVLDQAINETLAFAGGGTRLYKSIEEVCRRVSDLTPTSLPVMVVLSDGLDTTKTKAKEALAVALETDMKLYPVVLGHLRSVQRAQASNSRARQNPDGSWNTGKGGAMATNPGGSRPEFRDSGVRVGSPSPARSRNMERELRMEEFANLGKKTGGRSFDPREMNVTTLDTILQIVVDNVRSEYVAGYYASPRLKKGKHKVKVELREKKLGKVDGGEKEFVHGG